MRFLPLAVALAFGFAAPVFAADWSIDSFTADMTINVDASIEVVETIAASFLVPKHGIFRQIPYRYRNDVDGTTVTIPIRIEGVTDDLGQHIDYTLDDNGSEVVLKIGDPNATVTGKQIYAITYHAQAVVNFFPDHDELYWNVTGTNWDAPITSSSAVVTVPNGIDSDLIQTKCFTGPEGSRNQDCQIAVGDNNVTFTANDLLTVVVGLPAGTIRRPDNYDDLRSTGGVSEAGESSSFTIVKTVINGLLVIAALIFLTWWWQTRGRDPASYQAKVVQYDPPGKILPGEMGVLVDERADITDISSTIIHLAVRGHLTIREVVDEKLLGLMKKRDYILEKRNADTKTLKDYERQVLAGIFAEGVTDVRLSDLKRKFYKHLPDIRTALYDQVVSDKYFVTSPDRVRTVYVITGVIVAIIGGFLFITGWFAVSVIGVLIIIFSRFLPKRTKNGADALWHTRGFKEYLKTAERYRLQWQEKEHIFEQFLPYAMVLGVAEKWSQTFKDVMTTPPSWYQGTAGTHFNSVLLWSALSDFHSSAASILPSTPASSGSSGFGGGGFSGGGFGGGGGGSW